MKRKQNKVRVTLDLTPRSYERLERLEGLMDASSKAEVLRQALQVLEYIAEQTRDGTEFRVRRPDGSDQALVLLGSGLSSNS